MANLSEMPEEVRARVDAIAARSSLTASQVIADALEHGRSLDWQERFLDRVEAGVAEAEQKKFAADSEIQAVLTKFAT